MANELRVKYGCPLGSKCEEIKEDNEGQYIERCVGYIKLKGRNPQTGELIEERRCSLLEWMPILMIEHTKTQNETGTSVDMLREETSKIDFGSQILGALQQIKTIADAKKPQLEGHSDED